MLALQELYMLSAFVHTVSDGCSVDSETSEDLALWYCFMGQQLHDSDKDRIAVPRAQKATPAGGTLSNFDGKIKFAWKTYKTWSQKLRLPIARVTWCCLNQGNPLTYGHARHLLTVTLRDFSHPPQKKSSHFNSRVTSASRIILWSRALNFNRNIRSSQWAWSTMNCHRQNVPGKISVEINDCCLHLHQLYADTSQWSPRRQRERRVDRDDCLSDS